MNFGASTLGQVGIQTVSASASAFITGFYVIFTPLIVYMFPWTQKDATKITFKTWLAVGGSMIGLFIISDSNFGELRIGYGESLTMGSALFWTMHILVTERAVEHFDPVDLTFYEMVGNIIVLRLYILSTYIYF